MFAGTYSLPLKRSCTFTFYLGKNFSLAKKRIARNVRKGLIQDKTKVLSVQLGKTLSFVKFVVEWCGVGWRGGKGG